jgi:hypothetical protein
VFYHFAFLDPTIIKEPLTLASGSLETNKHSWQRILATAIFAGAIFFFVRDTIGEATWIKNHKILI